MKFMAFPGATRSVLLLMNSGKEEIEVEITIQVNDTHLLQRSKVWG